MSPFARTDRQLDPNERRGITRNGEVLLVQHGAGDGRRLRTGLTGQQHPARQHRDDQDNRCKRCNELLNILFLPLFVESL